jgi:hypothetical protein
MTDREQRIGSKTGMDPNKMRRDRVPKSDEVVGEAVPDESKERHTEIAIEAGRTTGERHGDKR